MKLVCTLWTVCPTITWITYTFVQINSIYTSTMGARVWFTVIYIFTISFAVAYYKAWIKVVFTFITICSTITRITYTCVWNDPIYATSIFARVWVTIICIFNVSIAEVGCKLNKWMKNLIYTISAVCSTIPSTT